MQDGRRRVERRRKGQGLLCNVGFSIFVPFSGWKTKSILQGEPFVTFPPLLRLLLPLPPPPSFRRRRRCRCRRRYRISLYLSIFSLIRIPLTTHRENGLCAVYRCRR